ncbi:MAG: hydrogenase nickel incorporation protein HypB [Atopobiaceae bacterium]|nr:hydrogenase nickel incorporation protein HypB [Atopobiaceae bacterium]
MGELRIIELKQSVFEANDRAADELREELRHQGTFLLNVMSSPGAGKTTTLSRTIQALSDKLDIAVLEADIDSDVDARTIQQTGVPCVQLHTGGMCHLDAGMTRQGLDALREFIREQSITPHADERAIDGDASDEMELIFLENVGNLVCPAEFDTGASANIAILSVPEGDDKPLKYPLMFEVCDLVLVNKIDVLPYFDFSLERLEQNVKLRNPEARIIPICATTGQGMDAWYDWLIDRVHAWRA